MAEELKPDDLPPAFVEFVRLDRRGRAVVRNVSGRRIEAGELCVIIPTATETPPDRCLWTGCTADAAPGKEFCGPHGERIRPCLSSGCPAYVGVPDRYCAACRGDRRDFYPPL